MLKYFKGSFLFTFIGFLLAAGVAYGYGESTAGMIKFLFIVFVLTILEISLSFDNAVVNAVILKDMTPKWRHRFLTWGILIAVFGMRLVFPLAIVSILAWVSPWESLMMAIFEQERYAQLMLSSHVQIAAFGGAFLLMVGLKYFVDYAKEVHWIPWIEGPLSKVGKMESVEIGLGVLTVLLLSRFVAEASQMTFLSAGLWGIFTHILVGGISSLLEFEGENHSLERMSAGSFLYLEVLDASFSFDGVIGAFAITTNLFIIMIGLSIGAFFVRSLTIYFVEEKTLDSFRFLEHGAFYAILVLAGIMLMSPFVHIPEYVTGLLGAALIFVSFLSSLKYRRKNGTAA